MREQRVHVIGADERQRDAERRRQRQQDYPVNRPCAVCTRTCAAA
jgi:hypothetical protein